ncbi:MAG: hypothetical protein U1A78_02970 [Polyangia bacterium]
MTVPTPPETPADAVRVVFTSPRVLPAAKSLPGRVAVLDVAFAADGLGTSYEEITHRFIRELGSRLAIWVDHHDHERHADFAGDPRFVLCKKSEHGACPEMITEERVRAAGPIGSIVCHLDVDGLYAAAKWLRGGTEPYPGADEDARIVDTRVGTPGPIAAAIDKALRARFRDEALKHRVVRYLVGGAADPEHAQVIAEAAAEFDVMEEETARLAARFEGLGAAAVYVDAQLHARRPFDKTELLLRGQERAPIAVVRHSGFVTLAAAFDSGVDFLVMFALSGGMPTRVSMPEKRLPEVLEKLRALPPRG